jgi:hypothetical protein
VSNDFPNQQAHGGGAWEICAPFDIKNASRNMNLAKAQSGFLWLVRQPHSAGETSERRWKFKQWLKTSLNFGCRTLAREEALAA